ncbi:hypothetical protein Isop_0882 [Isosphaera pallida ATCC 43644]|uniref:Uncharacterized protein n=1 Tax=Isosphaera pallida (strain ATCC 43644 / DSM 9630 / IS1B) TaxID=575540 RepID=E8R2W8_ISOPI|nr:EscU/YscU/HrcU family type III secretion system export apparatus switch protein [Isosphaera pallida]ADV61472.1 hypothetical protein Isop_0882 [Isosphaera pallida ATCC 43644]
MSEERTQAPTPRQRAEARRNGLVPFAPNLTAAAGLAAGLVGLAAWGNAAASGWIGLATRSWSDLMLNPPSHAPLSINHATTSVTSLVLATVTPTLNIILAPVVAMTLIHVTQTLGNITPARLIPDPRRLWRPHHWEELGMGTALGRGVGEALRFLGFLGATIGVVGWGLMAVDHVSETMTTFPLPNALPSRFAQAVQLTWRWSLSLTAGLAILGLLEFAWRWRDVERRLMRTPEENRDERRSSESNPAWRARRRELARQRGLRLDPRQDRTANLAATPPSLSVPSNLERPADPSLPIGSIGRRDPGESAS